MVLDDLGPLIQSFLHFPLLQLVVFESPEAEDIQEDAPDVMQDSEQTFDDHDYGGNEPDCCQHDGSVLLLHEDLINNDQDEADCSVGHNPLAKKFGLTPVVVILALAVFDGGRPVLLNPFSAPCHIVHVTEGIYDKCVRIGGLVVKVG